MAKNPFIPTLNEIRTAPPGKLNGYAVAEAFDQMSKVVKQLNDQIAAIKPTTTAVTQQQTTAPPASSTSSTPMTTAPSFSVITTGANSGATMVVGSGASLNYAGVGTINASSIAGVSVSGTPTPGDVLFVTSATTAAWGPLGMISAIDCMNPASYRGGIDCGSLS
jgi:hypothetical protein